MVNASLRREGIEFVINLKHSIRRSCEMIGMSRTSFSYKRRRDDRPLGDQLKRIAMKFKRFGYRRSWAMLRREGQIINHKRVERVWKRSGLTLPRKSPRKPRPGNSSVPCRAAFINHVWTYDFLFDSVANGRS